MIIYFNHRGKIAFVRQECLKTRMILKIRMKNKMCNVSWFRLLVFKMGSKDHPYPLWLLNMQIPGPPSRLT